MSAFLPIVSLLVSTFFLMAGAGLQGILLPVRGSIEGWSSYEIGFVGTGYAVGFTLGCLVVPHIVRRAGHVRTFSSLCAVLVIAVQAYALIVDPVFWVLFRATAGFALAGSYMVIESWLNERVTNDSRGRLFSFYMIVSMAAQMGGQYMMPLASPEETTAFILCAMLFAFAVIPTALSRAPSPKPLTRTRLDLPLIFRNSPAAAVGVFLSGILSSSWSNMAPVFGRSVGFSTTQIATLLVTTMAGGIVSQYPLGRLSDRLDRRYVMTIVGLVGFLLAAAALTVSSRDPLVLFAFAFVLGGVIYPAYSLTVAHANDYATAEDFVKISGGLLILYGFGAMFGPLLAAWLMETLGPSGIFAATGVAHTAYGGYALFRTFRRAAPPAAGRGDVRTTPLAAVQTPGAFALDPRAENGLATPAARPSPGPSPAASPASGPMDMAPERRS